MGESVDNAILGQLPKRIIIDFIDNKVFNVDKNLNPFYFKNCGLNFFSLYISKFPIDHYSRTFRKTNRSTLKFITPYSPKPAFTFWTRVISRGTYANGYTLFAFDLTSDLSTNCTGHWNLMKHRSLRLEEIRKSSFRNY